MNSTNKIALVTGGSRGLGRDMAISLARKGINVLLTYNSNETAAQEVVTEIETIGQKAAALQLNTGDIKSLDAFITQMASTLKESFDADRFDFLINNAGIGVYAPFEKTTEAQFDELMNIQFKGVFFLTQKALLLLNDGGRIINLSTGLARFTRPGYSAYASMKGSIETLSKYLALELGARRIAINVVAPGPIETDFIDGGVRDNPQVNKILASQAALGRVGLPDDIGSVVAFLCTDDAKWINGQRIEVSGGISL